MTDTMRASLQELRPSGRPVDVYVTHYGESYNGHGLGCDDTVYSSFDPTIVAVGPGREREWPCGTAFLICGAGGCLWAERRDACPGCSPYVIDLSERGLYLVCGAGAGVCTARVQAFQPRLACPFKAWETAEPALTGDVWLALGRAITTAVATGVNHSFGLSHSDTVAARCSPG
ncbi:MAG TPA: hypothetical protein VNN21_03350 [Dehalococcoidia bacterium]|nr:hypothetical protein [Dehalococcoidia bacterium]